MNTTEIILTAEIIVNKDVVKHLSLGLYRNFALAIKELISNSYDAGATEVKLKLDFKNNRIILRDNGKGISETEFKKEYLNIGHYKEPSKELDDLGRLRIGTFGIGFLAPIPYCKTLKIITKKRNQKHSLIAEIKAEKFFKKGNWEIKKEKVQYTLPISDLPLSEGETIIILDGIKDQIKNELLRDNKIKRTIEGSGYEKFKWTLAQYCPIEFPPEKNELRQFFHVENRVPLKLWLDGDELFRNVPDSVQILEKKKVKFGEIEIKYVVMTPFVTVQPEEMRGFQLRLRDVAIGFPRDFDVTKLGRVLGKRNMLCGEVHIIKGLDNALLVNRDNFNFTEEVAQMNEYFRGRITYWNDRLYSWANNDKEIYLALGELVEDEKIIENLRNVNLLHFSKERMRLSQGSLQKTKGKTVDNPAERIISVLSKKAGNKLKIIIKKDLPSPTSSPVQISKNQKTITIYKEHASFVEKIEFQNIQYISKYDSWDPEDTAYSICKINPDTKTVIFNRSHPLFKSKLHDNIVKHISMGIIIILNNVDSKESLIKDFNKLIEDTFSEL